MPGREFYQLAPLQMQIVTTFLYEPVGYLDVLMQLSTGLTFRQLADAGIEIDDFVRADALQPETDIAFVGGDPINGDPTPTECAMYWWIWKHDGEDPAQLPPPGDQAAWSDTLFRFEASIFAGFNRASMHVRDDTGEQILLYDETGSQVNMVKPGFQLLLQQLLGTKILDVFL